MKLIVISVHFSFLYDCVRLFNLTGPVVLRMDSQQIHSIVTMINSVLTIANKSEVNQPAVAKSLTRTLTSLSTGKVRAGIVGLLKAGKSTTLNAMLSGMYLPSSILAQTAGEVCIEHSAQLPEGALAAQKEEGGEVSVPIANGKKPIHDAIYELNERARQNPKGAAEYSKLILRAPMHFLKDATDVSLEISDTPGVNEAGNRHISEVGHQALRDLCAFVVILNLQYLELDGNSQLLRKLENLHPDILTELSRIIILVNAYDIIYDDDSRTLTPDNIPRRVSEHLRKSDVLGAVIPPEQIIPYSARWALRAREWSANPDVLLKGSMSKSWYSKAVLLLHDAGYEKQVEPLSEMNEANIRKLCPHLEEFSQIQKVEEKLEEMLYKHGPKILVRGACSDTKGEIRKLKSAIQSLEKNESIEKKQATVGGQTRLITTLRNVTTPHLQQLKQLPNLVSSAAEAQLNAITAALENSISSQINSKVVGHLSDLHQCKDRQAVRSRICSIKTVITTPSANEMQKSWNAAMSVTRDLQKQQVNAILSQLKTELTAELSKQATAAGMDPSMASLGNTVISQIAQEFRRLDPASFLPAAPTLQLLLSTDTITDASLDAHITPGTVTEHRQEERIEKGDRKYGIAGPKKKIRYTVSVPYQVPVYSLNMGTLLATFSSLASQWRQQFRAKLNEAVSQSSGHITQQALAAVNKAITPPQQGLEAARTKSKASLEASNRKVETLKAHLEELKRVEKELKP